jgi:nucleoside-diphosphate-sugar epimerase
VSDTVRLESPLPLAEARVRVLVTGAAGNIGSGFAAHAGGRLDLILTDKPGVDMSALEPYGQVTHCDLTDLSHLKELCCGVDTILHLGAESSPVAAWESLLPANIVGTYNIFMAARAAGCRRVVFASSVHAMTGYPPDRQITPGDPVNPGNLYGVSKCFGEALGRYMAEQEGLSVIAVRIGAFQTPEAAAQPGSSWMGPTFLAVEDMYQLLLQAIWVSNIRFALCHVMSDSPFKRMDITQTQELLGFAPAYRYPGHQA